MVQEMGEVYNFMGLSMLIPGCVMILTLIREQDDDEQKTVLFG